MFYFILLKIIIIIFDLKFIKKEFFLCMLDGQNSSIIDFSLNGKFMNNFIFNPLNDEDEIYFKIPISSSFNLTKILKKDILIISCKREEEDEIF